jgi:adenine-specific DNA methylase
MASLLPDPADDRCPEEFRLVARETLKDFTGRNLSDPLELGRKLLDFVGNFADWDNVHNPQFVKAARQLVQAAHPEGPPMVLDPFAGIGSIPFEALRIGADAYASDLNPVAVLLEKVALEYLPTYGHKLAEAVRKWGQWVRDRAAEELNEFYPKEADGSIPLAYLWARTIRCEGPGCGAEVPLVGLLWLSRREKQRVALRYRSDKARKEVVFEVFHPKSESEVQPPIVRRFSATCPVCGYTTPYARVREQIRAKRGGTRDARLIAVITLKRDGSRGFRLATERDVEVAELAAQELARREREHAGPLPLVPDEPIPPERAQGNSGFRMLLYGMETWGDLFTLRQALALATFVRLVREAHAEILQETGDAGFARAVATSLAVAVSSMSPYHASTSFNHPAFGIREVFLGSGLPMKPDFAEGNPLIPRLVPGFSYYLEQVAQVLEREGSQGFRPGTVRQGSATTIPLPDGFAPYVVTDPPYYDAIAYADLSSFCYVWLKRMVGDLHSDLFRFPLPPKAEECIMDPPEKPREFFETTMERSLAECRRVLRPDGLAVVLFAHKGTAGWEALLNALVRAGWTVTASWPIETERASRKQAVGSAVLQSSVFLVCRPRLENAGVGDWRRVLEEMNRKVAEWLPRLEKEGIHGADAIFACIGPALEVYSRYERVETASGQVIPLGDLKNGKGQILQRGCLSYVWEAVAREALKLIFPEADPAGFEEDARVTAMWLWALRARINGERSGKTQEEILEPEEETGEIQGKKSFGFYLPYDDARLIIQGVGASEERLTRPGGILEVEGNSARLLSAGERRRFLLRQDSRTQRVHRRRGQQQTLFEEISSEPEVLENIEPGHTTLDRLHQAMLLFGEGRNESLRWLLVDEGVGQDGKFWRLADALSRLYSPSSPEKRLVDGLLARKKSWGL